MQYNNHSRVGQASAVFRLWLVLTGHIWTHIPAQRERPFRPNVNSHSGST